MKESETEQYNGEHVVFEPTYKLIIPIHTIWMQAALSTTPPGKSVSNKCYHS